MAALRLSSSLARTFVARRAAIGQLRLNSTAASAKISTIVDQISQLTLLETADLVAQLKEKLNIQDIAPVAAAPAAAAPAADAAPAEEVAQEKTIFNIKLASFDAAAKAKVIREVKTLLALNLVEAKKLVESATDAKPALLKEGVTKEDAEKIKTTLEGLGAKVALD
ncbi:54S ribosomal protein L12, mitochondrial [Saitoella coloradoensis]